MTISEKKREKIIELKEKRLKLKEITILTGVSERTCRKIIKNYKEQNNNIEEIEDDNMDSEEEEKRKKTKKSGWDLSIIDENTQLKYELNQLASQYGRDLNEFLSDIKDICFTWLRHTDNPIGMLDYSFYLATLIMKLKIKDERVIDFLINAMKEDKELENFEAKMEHLEELMAEEIEDHEAKLVNLEAKFENYMNLIKKAKTASYIETQKFLKGNPKLPELEAENKEMEEKIKEIVKSTDLVINENLSLKTTLTALEKYYNSIPEAKIYLNQFKNLILGELRNEKLQFEKKTNA